MDVSFQDVEEEELLDDPDAEASENDSSDYSSGSDVEPGADAQDAPDEVDEPTGAEGVTVESRIESDFESLIQSIRQSDGPDTGEGMLSRMWNVNLEEKDTEFYDDLREASGIGKRSKRKKGRRIGPVLSHQVKVMIGEGNQAYVDSKIPEAVRIMQDVIRIEPRAASAWSVLAQCHADMNEHQKALQLRVMAAHLLHDSEEWDRLARHSRDLGFTQQALYCYGKVYSLDPTHVNAMWDRASLAREAGDLRVAKHALMHLLNCVPHDLVVLDELRPILIEMSELGLCASLFEAAFEHYQGVHPSGAPPAGSGAGFDALQLLVLADLDNALGAAPAAVHAVRAGTRWLQGRGAQKFWDACEDDREYDIAGAPLAREGELRPGMYPLDVNARHRLAIARIKNGDYDEGKMHASIILAEDVMDYAPLFSELADALFEREMYADARPIYEMLGTDAGTSSIYVLEQSAACRRALGEHEEAVEVYEHIIAVDPSNNDAKMKLAEIYEIMNEPRKALDLVYQVIDARRRKLNSRGEQSRTQGGGEDVGSFFAENADRSMRSRPRASENKLSLPELRTLEAEKERETLRAYARAQELWPRVVGDTPAEEQQQAEREWLFEVERLIEMFRETRRLFTSNRGPFRGMWKKAGGRKAISDDAQDAMASRLQLDMAYDAMQGKKGIDDSKMAIFRGIHVSDWLGIIMQAGIRYTFRLTRRDEYELAEEVLLHIIHSNAYQDVEAQDIIRLTLMACAAAANRHLVVVVQARKVMNNHQFNNELVRVFFASLAGSMRAADAFIDTALQKHIFRELRIVESALVHPDALRWAPSKKKWGIVKGKGALREDALDEDEEDAEQPEAKPSKVPLCPFPTKENPVLMTLYGQMTATAKSYQSAIFYLLHAYDWCPQDPIICLSLGLASIGRAMQRQADNRHHLVAQGMAFLSQYRDIRYSEAEDEVEYNFGRAFQQLGLHTLAVRHYERVLARAEGKPETDWSVAREAAYNLSLIFVTNGAAPLAHKLYEKWLSI